MIDSAEALARNSTHCHRQAVRLIVSLRTAESIFGDYSVVGLGQCMPPRTYLSIPDAGKVVPTEWPELRSGGCQEAPQHVASETAGSALTLPGTNRITTRADHRVRWQ